MASKLFSEPKKNKHIVYVSPDGNGYPQVFYLNQSKEDCMIIYPIVNLIENYKCKYSTLIKDCSNTDCNIDQMLFQLRGAVIFLNMDLNIYHNDIKINNIGYIIEDNDYIFKIFDFGEASEGPPVPSTRGTCLYMSPFRADDRFSDIY